MKVIDSVLMMQKMSRETKTNGRRIGLVPTMGFLHEGHLSLIRRAQKETDIVIVSIFINPTQFAPGEDLESYPRDFQRDLKLCKDCGVDTVFCPAADEIYTPDHSVYVEEKKISRGLCGKSRPDHFRGVTTIVAKLFNIVVPDVAVFGQKDAQQAAVIKRMVRDLNCPVEIIVSKIVRDPDGLAMSSRNTYLSDNERQNALWLHRSLNQVQNLYEAGEKNACILKERISMLLSDNAPLIQIEYIEIVDSNTLENINQIKDKTLVAIAVKVGKTRLIDNIILG